MSSEVVQVLRLTPGEVNQVEYMIKKLAESPYTRRAQVITWKPDLDPRADYPPCLQRMWLRCTEEGGALCLHMNAHWRSRDAYKAAFMNMFALSELHKEFAKMLSEKTGGEIRVGGYVDISVSYHIYGRDLRDFEKRFLKALEEREFYSENIGFWRNIQSDHPLVKREIEEAEELRRGGGVVVVMKEAIAKAAPNSGYILSSSSIHPGVKPENFVAMVDVAKRYGRYPIDKSLIEKYSKRSFYSKLLPKPFSN